MKHLYYDRAGNPITVEELDWMLGRPEIRRVAFEVLEGDVRVSTVWLGIDYRLFDDGPPLIFETMVFNGPHDLEAVRYSTEDEARAGHAAIVAALRGEHPPE